MLNLDPGKLLVIGVVAIILLGPDRLPQMARQIGGAWKTFTDFRHRMESEVRNTMPDLPDTSEIARLARSPSALLEHLSNMASDEEPDGSFQPPDLQNENGSAVAQGDAADVAVGHRDAEPGAGVDETSDGSLTPAPDDTVTPGPARAPAPTPARAPIDLPRPPWAPKPSGVVIPGDPTLN